MKFPHYSQLEQKDCGATCLKIIAKYYGKIFELQYLRNLCGSSREGVSIMSLSQAAETIGLRTSVFEITFDQLFEKMTLPCIIHWNQNHFVVVYKVTKRKVWVSDPAKRRIAYTHQEFKNHWLGLNGRKAGVVMALEPQPFFYKIEDTEASNNKTTYFQLVYKYLNGYKKELWQLGVVMLLITVLQAVLPFIFRAIVDVGVGRNDLDFINIILIANVILIISIALANFIRDWIIKHIGSRFSIALISDYLIKLMRMPLQHFETRMVGDTLSTVRDHERIKNFVLNHFVNVIFALLSFSVFSLILYIFNLYLFLIFLIGTSIYIIWVISFMRFQEKLDWNYHNISSQNQGYWIETLSTISEIKVNNYEQKRRWKWEKIQASLYQINLRIMKINNLQNIGSQLINGLKNVFLTFYSAKAVLNGSMTLGVMISLQFIIGFLNTPIHQFVAFIQAYTSTKVSFMRLNELHNINDEETSQNPSNFSFPNNQSIELKNVFFRYSNSDPFALRNISIIIPNGKITAIVGKSGSGKTTLLKLLLRLYKPTSGDIFIGITSINNINVKTWRNQCASVLQDGKIFNDTILNNIVLNDERVDYNKVSDVVRATKLKEIIEVLPLGYHTRVGERGRGVSQGQKQRILIARALYRNPDYLFLDEATNSLDSINEQEIGAELGKVFNNKTVVVAAHRLSTIKNADQIIVMDKGSIVALGSHEKLIEKSSHYKKLVLNQMSAQKQETPLS